MFFQIKGQHAILIKCKGWPNSREVKASVKRHPPSSLKIRVTRLSLTKKFVDLWSRFVSQPQVRLFRCSHCENLRNSHAILRYRFATCEFCDHRLGYLDVAIAKISETRMQSCAIDLRPASFATIGQVIQMYPLRKFAKLACNLALQICNMRVL